MHLSVLGRIAAGAALVIHTATAEAAPPSGCFERTYSAQHMREHPNQVVRRLIVSVGWDDGSQQNMFGVAAWLRGKRQVWRAGGPCAAEADVWKCRPDTDGDPAVLATTKGDKLEFSNPERLKVFDDRTGPGLNDAQVRAPANATFLLSRTDPAKCRSE